MAGIVRSRSYFIDEYFIFICYEKFNGKHVEYNRKLGFYFGYRTNQDLILGLSINISKQLYMIYSYDFTARFFSDFSNGSNDLVLRFNFIEEKKAYSPKDF